MIHINLQENIDTLYDIYVPRIDIIGGKGETKLTFSSNINPQLIFLVEDLSNSVLYYHFKIKFETTPPTGEYTYELNQGKKELGRGLASISKPKEKIKAYKR